MKMNPMKTLSGSMTMVLWKWNYNMGSDAERRKQENNDYIDKWIDSWNREQMKWGILSVNDK